MRSKLDNVLLERFLTLKYETTLRCVVSFSKSRSETVSSVHKATLQVDKFVLVEKIIKHHVHQLYSTVMYDFLVN
jgi:hypothetical protein